MAELGVYVVTDEAGRQTVTPTFTCPHCNRVNVLTKDSYRFWCGKHMRTTCPTEECANRCDDMDRVLKRIERRAEHLRTRGY